MPQNWHIENGVGTKAFCRCTALSDLDLGDSLTTISAYGFWGCTSLESVELPDTVRSLGTYAFQRCSSLSSIDLGESFRLIGTKAFDGTAIVSLDIPDTIVRLKEGALSGCSELREVIFEGGEKVILHAGIFDGTTNIERIVMPDGFKRIYAGALDGISFFDVDGSPLAATAKILAGHVFAGEGGELALIA
ncbi:MAG: leucine-rich repeat domain-containing protein [Candidatus Methanomethylophilaceae archaeon]|nr:leucine-rich repeat domain-containing protein [Candidatus Methanomethylophilaceae archaeon]MBR6038413.1 leucine-rich repeat domain-containing protein [Candidatus Methanomethylophilaceae archaeon]MBR6871865.1 leucine-rich repeat domain-containing protein [Candidatus Methanomethylophilaceae archaeon]